MRNAALAVPVIVLAGLAACAPAPGGPAIAAAAPIGLALVTPAPQGVAFHCPKPGTTATFNNASRPVVWQSADPAMRDGLSQLFPLVEGKTVRFDSYPGYANDPTKRDLHVQTWTVGRATTLQIAGQNVTVIPVVMQTDNTQGHGSNGWRVTNFYAPDSGVWVRGEPELLRGQVNGLRPYTATALTTP